MIRAMKNNDMRTEVRNRKSFYENEYSWSTVAKRISDKILEDE